MASAEPIRLGSLDPRPGRRYAVGVLPAPDRLIAARLTAFGELLEGGDLFRLLPRVARIPMPAGDDPSVGSGGQLAAILAETWPGPRIPVTSAPTPARRRRALRIAQSDAELDPVDLLGWLEGPGEALRRALRDLVRVIVEAEEGGIGGEELALLGFCLLLDRLEAEHARRGDDDAHRALLDLVVRDAVSAALEPLPEPDTRGHAASTRPAEWSPSTSTEPRPSTSTAPRPSTSTAPRPSTSTAPRPSTSTAPRPSTSTAPRPSTSLAPGPSRPAQRPSTHWAAPSARGSVRLGSGLALLVSPVALGGDPEGLAGRPVNPYRTVRAALALARRVIQTPIEPMRLRPIVEAIARRLLAGDEERAALTRAAHVEAARDAALALRALDGVSALGDVLTSASSLVATLYAEPRRARALRAVARLDTPAARAFRERLEAVSAPIAEPRLVERAELAALGGVSLRLDEILREERRRLRAGLRTARDETDHARGAGVWLDLGTPLLVPGRRDDRALVLLAILGSPVEGPHSDALAAAVEQHLFRPAARRLEEKAGAWLRVVERGRDRLAAEGPLEAVLPLALAWDRIRAGAESRVEASLPPRPALEELADLPDREAEETLEALVEATSPPRLRLPTAIALAFGPSTGDDLSPAWLRALGRLEVARRWAADLRERRRTGLTGHPPRLPLAGPPPGPILGEDVLSALRRVRSFRLEPERPATSFGSSLGYQLDGVAGEADPLRLHPIGGGLFELAPSLEGASP